MDTRDFLTAVLPSTGKRCIAVLSPQFKGMRQFFGDDNDWARTTAARADAKPAAQVFFGCASYADASSRTGDNVLAARAFWLDLDAGPNKPYATASEAALALESFRSRVGLPRPLIVASGNGLHAYWPLTEDITPDQWRTTARLLKTATRALGLEVDQSRTADIASVLRPVGTHHKKGAPKLVRVVNEAGPFEYEDIHNALAVIAGVSADDVDVIPGSAPANLAALGATTALATHREFAPADADRMADQCAVVASVREPEGKVDQPTWYHVLQLLGRCEGGEEIAHEWSAKDSRYTKAETDAAYARATEHGPTTCDKMADHNPSLCKACPHFGKIKSPISLGVRDAPPTPVMVEQPRGLFGADETAEDRVASQLKFPSGYDWGLVDKSYSQLYGWVPAATGDGFEKQAFCDTLYYPVERLAGEDSAAMEVEMVVRGDEKRRFVVRTSTIGEGGSALASILAAQEIVALPGLKMRQEGYMSGWVTQLKADREAIQAHTHFGWHDRNFLIGRTLLTPDGDRQVVVKEMALMKADALEPRGDLATWVDIIDQAYNYPGQEAYQFMVLLSFAAPLLSMFRQYGGVTAYAHSEGSGVGKTTAQRAGLSAFGNWQDLQLADGKTTMNAFWSLIGAYHNLPVMFDELTNMANALASEVVLSVSSGRQKERARPDGRLQTVNNNWSTIVLASGNNLLSEKLSLHRGNAEAEISRLFEFTVSHSSKLTPNQAGQLFPRLLDNYGHAGVQYMRHVVTNYDMVEKKLMQLHELINDEVEVKQSERYWSALIACVLTALTLCKGLGLVQFKVLPLKAWMVSTLENNRVHRDDNVGDPLELFGKMMTDLWPGMLVTQGEGDLRIKAGGAFVIGHPHGPMTGRCVVPSDQNTNERPMVALNSSAVRTWCNKNGVSAREMYNAVVSAGWADNEMRRYVLGRGVAQYAAITASPVKCWMIDPRRAGLDVANMPMATFLQPLSTGTHDDV